MGRLTSWASLSRTPPFSAPRLRPTPRPSLPHPSHLLLLIPPSIIRLSSQWTPFQIRPLAAVEALGTCVGVCDWLCTLPGMKKVQFMKLISFNQPFLSASHSSDLFHKALLACFSHSAEMPTFTVYPWHLESSIDWCTKLSDIWLALKLFNTQDVKHSRQLYQGEHWLSSSRATRTICCTWSNVRRCFLSLCLLGFPCWHLCTDLLPILYLVMQLLIYGIITL